MNIKQTIKEFLYSRQAPWLLSAFYFNQKEGTKRRQLHHILANKNDLMQAVSPNQREHWRMRIDKVLQAPENSNIFRDPQAGHFLEGSLIMHNGLKIDPLSYYSFPMLKMLIENKGVHEPEEERIFQEVTKHIAPTGKPTMLELGAYWSFYSMWFLSLFPDANCVMVEPDKRNLFYGKRNFDLNQLKGTFLHHGISKEENHVKNLSTVDVICKNQGIEFLDILHSDIQGYELDMLYGSKKMLAENRIGYIFISTHSNELHGDCREFLLRHDFREVANVDLDHSSSWDGILVMKSDHYEGLEKVDIEITQSANA